MFAGLLTEDIYFLSKIEAQLNYLQLLNKSYGEFSAKIMISKYLDVMLKKTQSLKNDSVTYIACFRRNKHT